MAAAIDIRTLGGELAAEPTGGPGWLDWRNHRTGPAQPCRICTRPAICRDERGDPCHKVCAETLPCHRRRRRSRPTRTAGGSTVARRHLRRPHRARRHALLLPPPTAGPPLRNTAGQLGWLVDTRAHGGYVVAAGSTPPAARTPSSTTPTSPSCPHGSPTAWRRNCYRRSNPSSSPARWPPGRLPRRSHPRQPRRHRRRPDGRLNATLYGGAVALGQLVAGGALDETSTADLLASAAIGKGHPERAARNTIRSSFRAGANRPRSVAA